MPALAALGALLQSIFAGLVAWFATWVSKRLAVTVAVVAALGAGLAAFIAAIESLISQVAIVAPGPVQVGLSMLPAETSTLLGVLLTAETAAYGYAWVREIVLAKAL